MQSAIEIAHLQAHDGEETARQARSALRHSPRGHRMMESGIGTGGEQYLYGALVGNGSLKAEDRHASPQEWLGPRHQGGRERLHYVDAHIRVDPLPGM
ncbi:MAG: hypothetical protein MZV64_17500 [Ignavibacteriales bacterium]|nr:hypothetical protein [Ignavibacteriales bacterium]